MQFIKDFEVIYIYYHIFSFFLCAVAPPRKLFANWTKVSLITTHDWRIKFKRANEKHSSEQVLRFQGFFCSKKNIWTCMFSCVVVDQIVIKYTLDVANFYSNTQRNSDFGQCYLYTVVGRNYSYGPLLTIHHISYIKRCVCSSVASPTI